MADHYLLELRSIIENPKMSIRLKNSHLQSLKQLLFQENQSIERKHVLQRIVKKNHKNQKNNLQKNESKVTRNSQNSIALELKPALQSQIIKMNEAQIQEIMLRDIKKIEKKHQVINKQVYSLIKIQQKLAKKSQIGNNFLKYLNQNKQINCILKSNLIDLQTLTQTLKGYNQLIEENNKFSAIKSNVYSQKIKQKQQLSYILEFDTIDLPLNSHPNNQNANQIYLNI